jgi:hypothetical protein
MAHLSTEPSYSPTICIHRGMGCLDEKNPERDETKFAAAQLVASMKRAHESECELPIVDESSVWIVTVKETGIVEEE